MIVERIQREHNLTTLAHLTCVNHTREEVGGILEKIRALGCKNILACAATRPAAANFSRRLAGLNSRRSSSNSSAGRVIFPSALRDFPKATLPIKRQTRRLAAFEGKG